MKRDHKGFTLAELLIVVAIVAVLAAIALPVFGAQLKKARLAVDHANIRVAKSVLSAANATGEITVDGRTMTLKEASTGAWYCLSMDGTLTAISPVQAPVDPYILQATGVPTSSSSGSVCPDCPNTKPSGPAGNSFRTMAQLHQKGGYIRITVTKIDGEYIACFGIDFSI